MDPCMLLTSHAGFVIGLREGVVDLVDPFAGTSPRGTLKLRLLMLIVTGHATSSVSGQRDICRCVGVYVSLPSRPSFEHRQCYLADALV